MSLKKHNFKLAATGVLALSGLLVSATASAAQVTGVGTLTINNTALAASSVNVGQGYPNGWVASKFWDASYNGAPMTGLTTPGGVALSPTGSTGPLLLPVNGAPNLALPNTSCPGDLSGPGSPCVVNNYPTVLDYGRTDQATTMTTAEALTSNGGGHQIGLSGAILLTSVNTNTGLQNLRPYDFRLTKSSNNWFISTYDNGFGYNNWFKLVNATQSVDLNDQLLLSGDLQWTGLWAGLVSANTSTLVGTFSLGAASPVPVPGAAWLFGGALSAMVAAARRKSVLPA